MSINIGPRRAKAGPYPIYRRVWIGAIGLMLLLLVGCGSPTTTTTTTATATVPPVHPSPTPTAPEGYTRINLGLPDEALYAPIVGALPNDTMLHVGITFKINLHLLDSLNKRVVQTGQQDLTKLANQLGISDQDFQRIKAFFGIEDASLTLNKLHTYLTIDGKASTFARLFRTRFVVHQLDRRKFFTPAVDAPPELPTLIANQVEAVSGLDNYSLPPQPGLMSPRSDTLTARDATNRAPTSPDCSFRTRKGFQLLTPAQVSHAYGYDQFYRAGLNGAGMTVNLLEFQGLAPSDLANYFSCVHYRGKLTTVAVNKGQPGPGSYEAMLDVEMIAGLAPAANIVSYQADLSKVQTYNDFWTLYNDVLQRMIDDNTKNTGSGNVVSISYSAPEATLTWGNLKAIDQSLQILTRAEHMTVFASSSDCGAFGLGNYVPDAWGKLAVHFPASDPWAVSVGGTMVTIDRKTHNVNNLAETAWSDGSNRKVCDNSWGSGGGLSQVFYRPSWQQGPGVQNRYSNGSREMPDVSAYSFLLTCYFQGHWYACGGTSASTPIWASGMVLVNEGLIRQVHAFFAGPQLFYGVAQIGVSNHLQPYRNVTRGNNLYYPATNGYNLATGFGSPNLPVFYEILLAAAKSQ